MKLHKDAIMKGGQNKKPLGYTIVEVMVFLAVSGFMFVVAATFINGKQANAQFRQGMNETNQAVQTVMNDVINGFYPVNSNFKCDADATHPPNPHGGSNTQGENLGCTFLGKVIQFDAADNTGARDGAHYNIYSVAGRQYAPNSTSVGPKNFTEAMPVAVDEPDINLTEYDTIKWGNTVSAMYSVDSLGNYTPIGAFGFFNGFGNFDGAGTLQSGASSAQVAIVPVVQLGNKEKVVTDNIPNITTPLSNPKIVICFNGANGLKASITVGGNNGQQLTTDLEIAGVDSKC